MKREVRRSLDEVLTRPATFGSGLNELDDILNDEVMSNLDAQRQEIRDQPKSAATNPAKFKVSSATAGSGTANVIVKASSSAEVVITVLAAIVGVSIKLGYAPCNWVVMLASLLTAALLLIGVENVKQIIREWVPPHGAGWRDVPLTDSTLDIANLNKFANSAQVREKGLKILQYVLKAGAYSALLSKTTSVHLKDLSKIVSIARRFFKFARWIKHFEDVAEAKEQKSAVMRFLLHFRIGANFGADWAEDICSLERIGLLPKGTLSVKFMLFAEYCQLALALVEASVTAVRMRKEQEITELAEAAPAREAAAAHKILLQRRKLALVRLEQVKYVSDLGKAVYDCELSFAHEGLFIGCSLFSAIVSTHKNMVKVLPKSKAPEPPAVARLVG